MKKNQKIPTRFLQLEPITAKRKLLIALSVILVTFAVLSGVLKLGVGVTFLSGIVAIGFVFATLIILLGDRYFKYTLIVPTVVVLFVVTIIPVVFLLVMSFTDVKLANFNKQWNFVGLSNYIHFFTKDKLFMPAFVRTFEYTILVLLIQLALGIGLALLLQKRFAGRNIVSSFLVIPVMTCPIVIAMLWKSMMNAENGVFNNLLRAGGMNPIPWLSNEALPFLTKIPVVGDFIIRHLNGNWGFFSVIMVNIWQWTPFVFLMVLSGLSALPTEPYEAATVDGANKWVIFRYITLPQLQPVISVVILMRLMDLMKVYDQIYALFGDNITMRTLNIHIFTIGLTNQDYGKASALSVIVLVFIILLTNGLMAATARMTKKEYD